MPSAVEQRMFSLRASFQGVEVPTSMGAIVILTFTWASSLFQVVDQSASNCILPYAFEGQKSE